MKFFQFSLAVTTLFAAAALHAASIDMNDPKRALGREGDVRIDAQLVRDTVTPGTPIGITYQIQNLSDTSVAIAAKVTDASYDEDSRTISISLGAEVPPDGNMPQMIVIAPGEKKVLQAGATPALRSTTMRSALAAMPRYVQLKVAILRDLKPFAKLIEKQDGRTKHRLNDEQFDQWFSSNDTIYLNSVPVHYQPVSPSDAEKRSASGAGF